MRIRQSFGRIITSLMLVALLCLAAGAAPTVGNMKIVRRADRTGRVDIYYDVSGASKIMYVSVSGSSDNGKTWTVIPNVTLMAGDVGAGIGNGKSRHIVWDAARDRAAYAPTTRYRVTADEIGGAVVHMLPGGVPLEMVRMPVGTFLMGSMRDTSPSKPSEFPAHMVGINYNFFIGKYPVTQKQWQAVTGKNPAYRQDGGDYPVELVSWDDCKEFVAALNKIGKGTFRLPSEAEWEYACRGGTRTRWFFADDPTSLTTYAWFAGNSMAGEEYVTHPVGLKLPNPFGLYDLFGNAWQWCEDDWHSIYKSAPIDGSAWKNDAARTTYRVLRGGGYCPPPSQCRSAYRYYTTPDYRDHYSGLRLVWTP
ncbi:formylglycine-generating enzyme family protein [bacterium]|nr:formylglycine-generating enzyme family protein [bacterium]